MNDLVVYSGPPPAGKDSKTGRFLAGNKLARGNPSPRKVSAFRASLFSCVTASDFRLIVNKLVEEAQKGEPWAVKLALSYLCGKGEDVELHQRLMVLESTITETGRK